MKIAELQRDSSFKVYTRPGKGHEMPVGLGRAVRLSRLALVCLRTHRWLTEHTDYFNRKLLWLFVPTGTIALEVTFVDLAPDHPLSHSHNFHWEYKSRPVDERGERGAQIKNTVEARAGAARVSNLRDRPNTTTTETNCSQIFCVSSCPWSYLIVARLKPFLFTFTNSCTCRRQPLRSAKQRFLRRRSIRRQCTHSSRATRRSAQSFPPKSPLPWTQTA